MWPRLQCFRHNGVVCVSANRFYDAPSVLPRESVVVNENTHEFWSTKCWVSIVDVYSNKTREVIEVAVALVVVACDVLHCCGNKEVLLLQTKDFALLVVVAWVQNFCYHFRLRLLLESAHVFALTKSSKVEWFFGSCRPQTQNANSVCLVTINKHIVWECFHFVAVNLLVDWAFVRPNFLYKTAKTHYLYLVGTFFEPNFATGQPVVWKFSLPAINNFLLEETVLKTQGVTHYREVFLGKTVQVASSKTAKTTIAKTCVWFEFVEIVEFYFVVFFEDVSKKFVHFHIEKVVLQRTTHQKFH